MPFKESLNEIVEARKRDGLAAEKEGLAWRELKASRLNQLKESEKLLVKMAEEKLVPYLENLNEAYYEGRGKIKTISLSEESNHMGTETLVHAYEPHLYGWGNVKAEIKIELYRPQEENIPSCYFRLWEKDAKGKQELVVYFPDMPTRVQTVTYFFGLIKGRNILEGEDWKIFNIEAPEALTQMEKYLLESSQKSRYFSFVPR